jgi:hypothetical protein
VLSSIASAHGQPRPPSTKLEANYRCNCHCLPLPPKCCAQVAGISTRRFAHSFREHMPRLYKIVCHMAATLHRKWMQCNKSEQEFIEACKRVGLHHQGPRCGRNPSSTARAQWLGCGRWRAALTLFAQPVFWRWSWSTWQLLRRCVGLTPGLCTCCDAFLVQKLSRS